MPPTYTHAHTHTTYSIGAAESFYNDLQLSLRYFSKVEHLKELFLIPYRPLKKRKKMKKHHQDTVIETTIFTDQTTGTATVMVAKRKNRNKQSRDRPGKRGEEGTLSGSFAFRHPSEKAPPSLTYREADTSPAKEVEKYNRHHVYYGSSKKPRTPRPADVKFHVGEVVRHSTEPYRGVVVGWDAQCLVSNCKGTRIIRTHVHVES